MLENIQNKLYIQLCHKLQWPITIKTKKVKQTKNQQQ